MLTGTLFFFFKNFRNFITKKMKKMKKSFVAPQSGRDLGHPPGRKQTFFKGALRETIC